MPETNQLSILFLCKKENQFAQRAASWLTDRFPNAVIFSADRTASLPDHVLNWSGDILISFISSWVLPASLLERAKIAAINFHPGSPDYPGTGCTNFALYDGAKDYGVTCHYMKAVVDTGDIIKVSRFALQPADTVYAVTMKCYELIEQQFYEIMDLLRKGDPLPVSGEKWTRKAYTRKELNELCEIKPGMTDEEIERRIRATTYEQPWAFIRIANRIFKLQP
jgi:methionyl-tRNA formyltransferase